MIWVLRFHALTVEMGHAVQSTHPGLDCRYHPKGCNRQDLPQKCSGNIHREGKERRCQAVKSRVYSMKREEDNEVLSGTVAYLSKH